MGWFQFLDSKSERLYFEQEEKYVWSIGHRRWNWVSESIYDWICGPTAPIVPHLPVNCDFLHSYESSAVIVLRMPYYKENLDNKQRWRELSGNNYSYLTDSVVILLGWWVCIIKHKTVGYGEIVNTQICKCYPVLEMK